MILLGLENDSYEGIVVTVMQDGQEIFAATLAAKTLFAPAEEPDEPDEPENPDLPISSDDPIEEPVDPTLSADPEAPADPLP